MASRPALALVRPRAPTALRAAAGRLAGVGLALVCLAGVLYLGARHTSVFAVESVEVTGAPRGVRAEVRAAAGGLVGTSLVGLDGDELVARLEALPSVRTAAYDRAFPRTLRIAVDPERPLAVVQTGAATWVVSERGRVVRAAGRTSGLPVIEAPGVALAPGAIVSDPGILTPLAALAALPRRFPLPVRAAALADGRVTLVAGDGTEIRLGEAVDVPLKLTVAKRVLGTLSTTERAALAYVDVTLPERPVAADNPQVEG